MITAKEANEISSGINKHIVPTMDVVYDQIKNQSFTSLTSVEVLIAKHLYDEVCKRLFENGFSVTRFENKPSPNEYETMTLLVSWKNPNRPEVRYFGAT